MATPLTPEQWLKILRAEGVRVEEYPGWRTRERDDETGLAFGPVRMFLNHHTAGRNDRDVVAKNGVAGLPAPLAHVYLARTGVATMCSAGRANHAGPMAVNAYASFRDEKTTHPAPSKASGTVDGNDVSYGLEAENRGDGQDVYPREQYDAWVRINTAVCRHHGWSAESIGCHKETSVEGKVDPRGPVEGYGSRGRFDFTPNQFRADVDERLRHPANWNPGDADEPPQEETDMQLSDKIKLGEWIPKYWPTDKGLQDREIPVDVALGSGYAHSRKAAENTTAILAQLGAQAATIDKLVAAIGSGGGLTAAEIRAAAEAGAQAALDRLGEALDSSS